MSLINPKDVVTEERLQEFYHVILPYLGGMPELMANKISRSDIYSTTEKMVGQWEDGKPLYQRSFSDSIGSSNTAGTFKSVTLRTLANTSIKRVVTSEKNGIGLPTYNQNNYIALVRFNNSGNNSDVVFITQQAFTSSDVISYTIQYTKTTDSATSIGVDTDYSTTEKIVGTWIDSKPLYQKTINFGEMPSAIGKNVPHGISNLGIIVSYKAITYTPTDLATGYQSPIPTGAWKVSTDGNAMEIYVLNGNIRITTTADWSGWYAYVTLQYTKTS